MPKHGVRNPIYPVSQTVRFTRVLEVGIDCGNVRHIASIAIVYIFRLQGS